jgi:cytosine/uracil/thiamine/allantoin permease
MGNTPVISVQLTFAPHFKSCAQKAFFSHDIQLLEKNDAIWPAKEITAFLVGMTVNVQS